ncbi:hypothetical protein MBCUT_10830 [Methanobrevibacter cuticularis]|uniref:DUF2119 domain-containing protein n=1 Tax=Methanobrevibacter cuticularis TaxID=47311 RepID=A0A166DZ68_9EURY|nr:DUF2119 domain-containing protein [Methanobrevibacter cuticularis]KZX16106.1 hypothetical protein MBCUT_10830 [Methanobrevibacter cuticularis]
MSYFRCIDKGKGPIKLFIGGLHGNEGKTTIDFLKSLKTNDFSNGRILIYNFDKTPYVSTLKEEYYSSAIGKKLIAIIKRYKPDFYTELHCYNLKNYKKLISNSRRTIEGVPPLIELRNHVLMSSVSPLIRMKYFDRNTVCKTLEIPCLDEQFLKSYPDNQNTTHVRDNNQINSTDFNMESSFKIYLDILKIIAKSNNRSEFENKMKDIYPEQVRLATEFAKDIFGEYFPPF